MDKLGPNEGKGFHLTKVHGEAFAVVLYEVDPPWSLAASHECIEMLIDPEGSFFTEPETAVTVTEQGGIKDDVGKSNYLVEACDPCGLSFYEIPVLGEDGVIVSNFCLPSFFYGDRKAKREEYDYNREIKAPRRPLNQGYLSFRENGEFLQLKRDLEGHYKIVRLQHPSKKDDRSHVDFRTHDPLARFVEHLEQAKIAHERASHLLGEALKAYLDGKTEEALTHLVKANGHHVNAKRLFDLAALETAGGRWPP